MSFKFQLTFALVINMFSLIGFSILAVLISDQKIIHFDSNIINFIQGFESHRLTSIMKFFTFLGSSTSILIISILVLFFLYKVLHHRSELLFFIVGLLGANVLFFSLKLIFHRARPDLHRLIEINGYSFPSGHATNAFTLYAMLTFLFWRHIRNRLGRTILIFISSIMILLIGLSRIYLGVHYPSDVIAGYFIASVWISMAIWFYQRYREKSFKKAISMDH